MLRPVRSAVDESGESLVGLAAFAFPGEHQWTRLTSAAMVHFDEAASLKRTIARVLPRFVRAGRRRIGRRNDDVVVEVAGQLVDDQRLSLLRLYDSSLPEVYGYLLRRSPNTATAEDLTAETFLAAATAVKQGPAELTVAWLIGVARHKLADHWRRAERDERRLHLLEPAADDDPWDVQIEAMRARQILEGLGAHHRGALTLRYLDGLSVPEVAEHLGRTVHATEALLVRARSAFRASYEGSGDEQS